MGEPSSATSGRMAGPRYRIANQRAYIVVATVCVSYTHLGGLMALYRNADMNETCQIEASSLVVFQPKLSLSSALLYRRLQLTNTFASAYDNVVSSQPYGE